MKISKDTKEAILKKAVHQPRALLREFAASHNVGYSTLSKWLKCYRDAQSKSASVSRIEHILATANLDETTLGIYCRERGLYSHQIETWKKELLKTSDDRSEKMMRDEMKLLKLENQQLKKEVVRKDKALAETAALLILKKKANLLWGVPEDD